MDKELLNSLKEKVSKQIMSRLSEYQLNFSKLTEAGLPLRRNIEPIFKAILKENHEIHLTHQEYEKILSDIISEIVGLGPINELLNDPTISEIMVNGAKEVYIERGGKLELTDITFMDEQHLLHVIEKILSPIGRRVTEFEPYIDARLSDGSRVNIVRSPVSSIGAILTIRKFSRRILSMDDLINLRTLNSFAAEFLKACAVSRLNILISGGSSSGKTTLLNILASFILEGERVIIIEDTREIHLNRRHSIFLETRLPTVEGKGEITIRDLLRNSLHMRPDRIIVGEVRSDEVLDMIQAMNTGHEGSMTSLHANSALDSLERAEVLALLGSPNMQSEVAKRQIITAFDLIIHMTRFPDGSRKIAQISEVLKAKEYLLQDILTLDEEKGELKLTGKIPTFYGQLKKRANYFSKEFELR